MASATPLPTRPPTTPPATAPTTAPTGPATMPAAMPAAAPPAAVPTPTPTGCAPGAPVIGSSLRSFDKFLSVAMRGTSTGGESPGGTRGKESAKRLMIGVAVALFGGEVPQRVDGEHVRDV